MQPAAHRVSFHADTDKVVGTKQIECLLFSQGHGLRAAVKILTEATARAKPEGVCGVALKSLKFECDWTE